MTSQTKGYAIEEDKVVTLPRPGLSVSNDPLLAVLREGTHRMLTQVVEAEVEAFLAPYAGLTDTADRRRVVRNGSIGFADISPGD